MNIPADLQYTKDHEWVKVDGDTATVGITDFAQSELGDIVYVDIEKLDEEVERDEVFGTVEAVKTVSDLFMPLSGEVVEFNEVREGWMIKISIKDASEVDGLLSAEAYKELVSA